MGTVFNLLHDQICCVLIYSIRPAINIYRLIFWLEQRLKNVDNINFSNFYFLGLNGINNVNVYKTIYLLIV